MPGRCIIAITEASTLPIAYNDKLTDYGIKSFTGTVGDSYDNALAETVNDLYKTELIYSQTWETLSKVEFVAMNWVYWWNHHHLHESQNYSTPEEVTNKYNQNHAKQLASKSESGQNSRHISCISTFVGMRP